jgi:hypothetical protein
LKVLGWRRDRRVCRVGFNLWSSSHGFMAV